MRLDVIEIKVNNWEAMLKWYSEVLGLTIIGKEDDDRFALLSTGGTMIGLIEERKIVKNPQHITPYWKVDNLEREVTRFLQEGVSFPKGIEQRHWGKQAVFNDPEGNVHYLCQEEG